jgi:hypothetical protein
VPASPGFVSVSARALGVGVAHLYGTDTERPEESTVGRAIVSALRVALDSYDDPRPEGDPIDLADIIGRLDASGRALDRQHYETAAGELPELLQQLYVLAGSEPAFAALHDAYRIVAAVAARYQKDELAAVASDRHVQLAPLTGDPLRVAVSASHRAGHQMRNGDYESGLRVLDRARAHLDSSPGGRAVAIQLDLRAAVLHARFGSSDRADEYIRDARMLSERFAPPARPYFNIDASPTNIDVHWCAAPVERYDAVESIRRGEQVRIADPDRPERVAHHYIDQARAWMLEGDRDRSLADLGIARRVAPRSTRHHPAVRETVLALADHERRATDSLARFARWAGIRL